MISAIFLFRRLKCPWRMFTLARWFQSKPLSERFAKNAKELEAQMRRYISKLKYSIRNALIAMATK
jgi:hypothetical protein